MSCREQGPCARREQEKAAGRVGPAAWRSETRSTVWCRIQSSSARDKRMQSIVSGPGSMAGPSAAPLACPRRKTPRSGVMDRAWERSQSNCAIQLWKPVFAPLESAGFDYCRSRPSRAVSPRGPWHADALPQLTQTRYAPAAAPRLIHRIPDGCRRRHRRNGIPNKAGQENSDRTAVPRARHFAKVGSLHIRPASCWCRRRACTAAPASRPAATTWGSIMRQGGRQWESSAEWMQAVLLGHFRPRSGMRRTRRRAGNTRVTGPAMAAFPRCGRVDRRNCRRAPVPGRTRSASGWGASPASRGRAA